VLSLPFSVVAIIRPHAVGPRLFLIILDTVSSLKYFFPSYIISFNISIYIESLYVNLILKVNFVRLS